MKTLVSIAAAGAIGLAGVAASVSGASANGWGPHGYGPYWQQHRPQPHFAYQYRRPAPDNGGALIAGALFGLAAGALAAEAFAPPPPPPEYPQYASAYDLHVAWCKQTYTSYDEPSDSWTDFEGGVHQCLEPAH